MARLLLEDIEPVLTDLTLRHKRNVLAIGFLGVLDSLLDIDISTAELFKVPLGDHIHFIGLIILIYFAFQFFVHARQDFFKWHRVIKDESLSLELLVFKQSPFYLPNKKLKANLDIRWDVAYLNLNLHRPAKQKQLSMSPMEGIKIVRSQALVFVLFDVLMPLAITSIAIFGAWPKI